MKSAGSVLKNKRQSLGLSVSQVATKLKIQQKYVEALEEDNSEVFDSKVIARGFLIKYCKLLDIDSSKVLPFWRRDFVVGGNFYSETDYSKRSKRFRVTPQFFAVFAVLTVVVAFLLFGTFQYYSFKRPPKINLLQPEDGALLDDEQVEIIGEAQNALELTLNNNDISMDSGGRFSESLAITSGTNKLTFKAVSALGVETTKSITIYGNFENSVNPANGPTSPDSENSLLLENTSTSPTYVEVKSGETTLFSGFLLNSTNKEFTGSSLFLYTDSVENLEIFYNNEVVELEEGKQGEFIKTFD